MILWQILFMDDGFILGKQVTHNKQTNKNSTPTWLKLFFLGR